MKRKIVLLSVVSLLATIICISPVFADTTEETWELVEENEILVDDVKYTETVYKHTEEYPMLTTYGLSGGLVMVGTTKYNVNYAIVKNGNSSEDGIDQTLGVSYTLTMNYQYKEENNIRGTKVTSASVTVDYGPDGTSLDYHEFEFVNEGTKFDDVILGSTGGYVSNRETYKRTTANASATAPSSFVFVSALGNGYASGVVYTLHLKRGTSSKWTAQKSLSC